VQHYLSLTKLETKTQQVLTGEHLPLRARALGHRGTQSFIFKNGKWISPDGKQDREQEADNLAEKWGFKR
jgi:hypothetical protein